MLCRFDGAIATLDMVVVLLNGIAGDLSGICVMLVQVCHHLGGNPHRAPVINPLLCQQYSRKEQCQGYACAVLEILIVDTGVEKRLATLFQPCSIVEIVGVE